MARPLRLEFTGALYHITSRGNRREYIFKDDEDHQHFLLLINQVCETYNWVWHAYCLMSNHYHLLIETPDANLSKGMRHLNGVDTQTHNRRHDRPGHVFQGRYKAILVEKLSYLLELARYIVLNPVRAQMVRSVRDWPWSSYLATAGQISAPEFLQTDWILAAFGKRKRQAMDAYQKFIAEEKGQPSPWQALRNQVYLGSETFVDKLQKHINMDKDLDEIPSSQRRPTAMTLENYLIYYGDRNIAIFKAYQSGGYTLKEISQYC
jgi:putative transposase